MNGKTIALWSVLVAVGTVIGWTLSIGMKVASFATIDRVDSVASAQIAVDRQVLAQFQAVEVKLTALQVGAAAQEKANDTDHAELRHRIERLQDATPRIAAGR